MSLNGSTSSWQSKDHIAKNANNNNNNKNNFFLNRCSIYDNNVNNDESDSDSCLYVGENGSDSLYTALIRNPNKIQDVNLLSPMVMTSGRRMPSSTNSVGMDSVFYPDSPMTPVKQNCLNNNEDDTLNEWDKINNIFASVSYILENDEVFKKENKSEKVSTVQKKNDYNSQNYNYEIIFQFLEDLNLSKYLNNFISNGFDDIEFLNNLLTHEDLFIIGIKDRTDQERILDAVKKLPISELIACEHNFNTINEWLNALHLNQYIQQFYKKNVCTISRIKQMWEIELITVLNIKMLGHRKRMMISLGLSKDELMRSKSRSSINFIEIYTDTKESQRASSTDKTNSESNSSSPTNKTSPMRQKSVTFSDKIEKIYEDSSESISEEVLQSLPVNTVTNNSESKSVLVTEPKSIQQNNVASNEIQEKKMVNKKSISSQYLKQYKLKNPLWKHDPEKLISDCCNYTVKYLGSAALNKLYSDKNPIKYAIDRLKNTTKASPYPLPSVILSVSIKGVQLLHPETKELLWNHDIKIIYNVCQDQEELNYFALVTKTDTDAYHYCHIFLCLTADLSTEIILTIGQTFDIAYEIFCKNNNFS